MIQPARVVLPSSSTPPTGSDNAHSRVLQEHSGNRQTNEYSYTQTVDQKYPVPLLTENSYVVHQPQPPVQHAPSQFYRHAPLPRSHHRSVVNRSQNPYWDPVYQAWCEKQARVLFHRFRSSDQYMKYRSRQQKEDKRGQEEQKWPDRLELAFFQALVRWEPMGRHKIMHKDKQRGRNELIADYIEELTGESRTRKQVSSHIQVLKPFVEHDPFIMRYLSKDDLRYKGPYGGRMASLHDPRRKSSYPVHPLQHHARSALPTINGPATHHLANVKAPLDPFEPIDFEMFVQQKLDDDHVTRLHTYTASLENSLQQQVPLDSRSLERDYRLLACIHRRRPLDCNVLTASASLGFPKNNFKDEKGNPIEGVELGISFLCRSRQLPAGTPICCSNMFYQDGDLLKDFSSRTESRMTATEDGKDVETQLKFGSTFWAKHLGYIANKLNHEASLGKDATNEVRAYLDAIEAFQEIVTLGADGTPERLLIINWKFRLSASGRGSTYWAQVNLPSLSSVSTEGYTIAAAEQSSSQQHQKGRVDSVHAEYFDATATSLPPFTDPQLQPALQSPFEYDTGTSNWAPAATNSYDDQPLSASAIEFPSNDFDFTGGNINLTYDPNLDFSTFDSSAFNFDADFSQTTDPSLQDYSQQTQAFSQQSPSQSQSQSQEYSQQTTSTDYSWENYSFHDSQSQSVTGASNYPVLSQSQHEVSFDGYGPSAGPSAHYEQPYHVSVEGQAYGGAGQGAVAQVKEEFMDDGGDDETYAGAAHNGV